MRVDLFDFDLPPELIALRPARPRDSARMLLVEGAESLRDCIRSRSAQPVAARRRAGLQRHARHSRAIDRTAGQRHHRRDLAQTDRCAIVAGVHPQRETIEARRRRRFRPRRVGGGARTARGWQLHAVFRRGRARRNPARTRRLHAIATLYRGQAPHRRAGCGRLPNHVRPRQGGRRRADRRAAFYARIDRCAGRRRHRQRNADLACGGRYVSARKGRRYGRSRDACGMGADRCGDRRPSERRSRRWRTADLRRHDRPAPARKRSR